MADDEDDPFADFEAPDDDPFEDLEGPDEAGSAEEAPGDGPAEAPPGRLPDDPFDRPESAGASETAHASGPTETGDAADSGASAAADPGDAADATGPSPEPDDAAVGGDDATTEPTDDPFASFSTPRQGDVDDPFGAFESVGVDGIDPDVVWNDLRNSDGPDSDERVYSEVSKHRFCEQCEHFSGPPEVRCTYDGAAIVEFLDVETVRLLNCPVVAEQEALEERGTELGGE